MKKKKDDITRRVEDLLTTGFDREGAIITLTFEGLQTLDYFKSLDTKTLKLRYEYYVKWGC